MSEELKACPFCGESDELYPAYHGMGGGKPYAIDCVGCGIDFTPREGIDATTAWNTRQDERAAVVAWLRSDVAGQIANTHPECMQDLVDAIERGKHLKGSE